MTKLKVLVDLNGYENYSIAVECSDHSIAFNAVYNEIIKHIKHHISYDTHVFEIYDTDFREYCVITSDKYLIENLSRIRVRSKANNALNHKSITHTFNGNTNETVVKDNNILHERNQRSVDNNVMTDRHRNASTSTIASSASALEATGAECSDNKLNTRIECNYGLNLNTNSNTSHNGENILVAQELPQNSTQTSVTKPPLKMTQKVVNKSKEDNQSTANEGIPQQFINQCLPDVLGLTTYKVKQNFEKIVLNVDYFMKNAHNMSNRDQVLDTNKDQVSHSNADEDLATSLAPGTHPSTPINYLDIELNTDFTTNSSSKHLPYITYTAKVGDQWVVAMRYSQGEHRAATRLIQVYETHISDCENTDFRDNVVKHMEKSGFKEWDYNMCLNYFYNALFLYQKTIANCPNVETAAIKCSDCHTTVINSISTTSHTVDTAGAVGTSSSSISVQNGPKINSSEVVKDSTGDQKCNAIPTLNTSSVIAPGDSEYNPIDYLGLTVNSNFTLNACSRHLSYKTYTFKLGRLLRQVKINFQTLIMCPNTERAGIVNPLFYSLHMFDMEFIIPTHEYNEIKSLRQKFGQTITTTTTSKSAIISAPVSIVQQKSPSSVTSSTSQSDPAIVKSGPKILPLFPISAIQTVPLGATGGKAVQQTVPKQTIGSKVAQKDPVINNDLHELRVKSAKISESDLLTFKTLCDCVDTTVRELGSFADNPKTFWSFVSIMMCERGYKFDTNTCSFMFNDSALKHLRKYTEAVKVYPFFSLIHDMDLSKTLSQTAYERIKPLKDKFKN
ncbi:unnamed protein product [Oppiella nova]|uniref:Uncharacterized protein n=1 Tax=Oppiella nova TaxID=334625 RepID=A0A7R9LNC8_9ACAR|nr:unnamed protein product [Oppiella nova]CAG2165352.1 unnamed protein product [Oppiella nova]